MFISIRCERMVEEKYISKYATDVRKKSKIHTTICTHNNVVLFALNSSVLLFNKRFY